MRQNPVYATMTTFCINRRNRHEGFKKTALLLKELMKTVMKEITKAPFNLKRPWI